MNFSFQHINIKTFNTFEADVKGKKYSVNVSRER